MNKKDIKANPGMFPWREMRELEGFGEAWQCVRGSLDECDAAGLSTEVILAALFSEMLPRLVAKYGPEGVAGVFHRMASAVANGVQTAKMVQ